MQTDLLHFGFLLGFILFDLISGYLYATISKTKNSAVMRLGFYHKVGEIMTVILFYSVKLYNNKFNIGIDLIDKFNLVECSCYYIILNEILSIKENINKIVTYKKITKGGKGKC